MLDRPQGRVDVLIGLQNSALHGRDVQQWGNLRLLKASFGCGWAIRGTHGSLRYDKIQSRPSYSSGLHALRNSDVGEPEFHQVFHMANVQGPAAEFQELNELGVTPAPACQRCVGCVDCTFRRNKLCREDQAVVARIEETMKVDPNSGIISCKYPWKPCVLRMRSNVEQATKIQASVEKHMLAAGTA